LFLYPKTHVGTITKALVNQGFNKEYIQFFDNDLLNISNDEQNLDIKRNWIAILGPEDKKLQESIGKKKASIFVLNDGKEDSSDDDIKFMITSLFNT
jgi:hypothetical protein